MNTKRWITLVFVAALLAGAFAALRSFSFGFWESTLMGPYTGIPFNYVLSSHPASALSLDDHRELSIYEIADMSAPVAVLRQGGEIVWTRVLVPLRQTPNGKMESAVLHDMKLLELLQRDGRPVIRFTCYWGWGGWEGGLIYLAPDYTFDHFAVSW